MAPIISVLKAITFGWLLALIALVRSLMSLCFRRDGSNDDEHERKRARTRCVPIEDPAFKRPDPLIYAQYFLMDHGFNVTWDNPDFAIFQGGAQVAAHELKPNTDYDVVVRVWNAALDCPVVLMPVHLSYLSFGVGTVSHPIGMQKVSVGVKGSATNPGYVTFRWTTPREDGHYCLQALLAPAADVEWGNNLGQHNTDVVTTHSPATFVFALRNGVVDRRQFGFRADGYELGPVSPCTDDPEERKRREAYHTADHPLPAGWKVDFVPAAPILSPLEEIAVQVTITPPTGWAGKQTVNVHTHYLDNSGVARPAGGVTVVVESA